MITLRWSASCKQLLKVFFELFMHWDFYLWFCTQVEAHTKQEVTDNERCVELKVSGRGWRLFLTWEIYFSLGSWTRTLCSRNRDVWREVGIVINVFAHQAQNIDPGDLVHITGWRHGIMLQGRDASRSGLLQFKIETLFIVNII